jgi:hypothetical protein
LAVWNSAVHAWTATCCDVAPDPLRVPESEGASLSAGLDVSPPSFEAQPARVRAAIAATAPSWAMREIFTVWILRVSGCEPCAGLAPDGRQRPLRVWAERVNGR